MAKAITSIAIAEDRIINKIYLIRGKKVMLDRDLAELYGVETRVLNQAVRRNEKRFPEDFMFQLAEGEFKDLISQNVTSSWGGIRRLPTHKDILIKLERMEKKMIKQGGKLQKHDRDIRLIFEYLKELLNPPQEPRPRVGFRRSDENV